MAFPTIVGGVGVATNGSSATTTPTFNLPSGIQAGDQLLLVVRVNTNPGLTLTTTGWGQQMNTAADASDDTLFIKRKTADGTEGTTLDGTFSASVKFAAIAVAFRGAAQGQINATPATGTSTTPNPPSFTAPGGVADNLWVWIGSWEGEQTSPPAGAPANYTGAIGADSGTGGAVASNCRVALAFRENAVATEDPPSWTISASDNWMAVTYVIPPATATPQAVDVTGSSTVALALAVTYARTIPVTGSSVVAISKLVQKGIAVAGSSAVVVRKLVSKGIAVAGSGTAAVQKLVQKGIAVSGSSTVALATQRVVLVAIDVVGSGVVALGRTLTLGRTVAVDGSSTVALATARIFGQAIAAVGASVVALGTLFIPGEGGAEPGKKWWQRFRRARWFRPWWRW